MFSCGRLPLPPSSPLAWSSSSFMVVGGGESKAKIQERDLAGGKGKPSKDRRVPLLQLNWSCFLANDNHPIIPLHVEKFK